MDSGERRLGVTISQMPVQFGDRGDLLNGQMFPTEINGQWVQAGRAFKTGACDTIHNDGPVSPPLPLFNVQAMVTRCTPSGQVHGPEQ